MKNTLVDELRTIAERRVSLTAPTVDLLERAAARIEELEAQVGQICGHAYPGQILGDDKLECDRPAGHDALYAEENGGKSFRKLDGHTYRRVRTDGLGRVRDVKLADPSDARS